MDLLTTVRKEGSRGGRGDFKWSDVQSSTHRENYLGHSLMAPVGRWQKGKDLNWYAKGEDVNENGETDAERATRERKEEIKRIKEAEQDALARALGFEVTPRNPNMEVLGDKQEVNRVLNDATEESGGKGLGLGHNARNTQIGENERIEGNAEDHDAELTKALREYRRRHGEATEVKNREGKHARHHRREFRRRSRSRSREQRSRRDRSRSRDHRNSRQYSRSRSQEHMDGGRYRDNAGLNRDRSRSPRNRRDERNDRYRRDNTRR